MRRADETAFPPSPASSPEETSRAHRRWFALAVVAVTALRLAAAAAVPLSGDEAYYWTWTQRPALGYHDHPPMVAWVIALSTALLGTATWTVRLPFVLMSAGVAWLTYGFCRQITGSPRAALWAGFLPLIVPLFTLAGVAVFPDGPLLLASAGFFFCAWRAVDAPDAGTPWWIASGACGGAAFMSKLTGLYLVPALFIFLALSGRHRPKLLTAGPWLMLAAAIAVASPFLWWNVTHQFESVVYQFGSRLGSTAVRRGWQTPLFLTLSALAITPVLYVLIAWATVRAGLEGAKGDARLLFVFCMAAPLHVVFLAVSCVTKVGLHWTAPGTLAAFTAYGAWMAAQPSRARRGLCGLGVALALLLSGLVYAFALAPKTLITGVAEGVQMAGVNSGRPLRTQEITELLGYPQMGADVRAKVEAARAEGDDPFLITTGYTLSSALWFYSGEPFHVIMGTRLGAQYDHWDDFPALRGHNALYFDTSPIDTREDVWQNLNDAFTSVTLEAPIVSWGRGVEARTLYTARCQDFRTDIFTPLKSINRR